MATRSHIGAARVRKAGLGGKVEPVDPILVFQRDDWICHLCDSPTSRNISDGCQPASPTIDHVVPVELGGDHTYQNIRTAHSRCNSVRGLKPVEIVRELVTNGKGIPQILDPIAAAIPIGDLVAFSATLASVPREWEGGPPSVSRLGGLS